MEPMPAAGDAVVIGAGPAGAAVAARLAEAGRQVVLVEAGADGPRPASTVGLDLVTASADTSRSWAELVVRDRPGGPARPYRQGRGLGGGSTINGMLLSPGDRLDYERWVDEWACVGWGPDDLAPWLDRARTHYRSQRLDPGPVGRAVAAAAEAAGHPTGGGSLEADRLGVLAAELAADRGRRWSAVDAHLGGDADVSPSPDGSTSSTGSAGSSAGGGPGPTVRRLPGRSMTVVAGVPVERIMADGAGRGGPTGPTGPDGPDGDDGRDHRVELADGTMIRTPLVVVCAGAIGSAALLLRSGLTARPVGSRLRDHPSYAFTVVLRDRPADDQGPDGRPSVVSTLVRWSSEPDWTGDLQAVVIDRVEPRGSTGPPLAVVAVGLMAVTSTGSVELGGPGGPGGRPMPEVVTGQLTTASDRRRLRQGVRTVAAWLRSEALADLVAEVHLDEDGRPVGDLDRLTAEEIDALLAASPGPYAHPAATCPMGPEDRAHAVVAHEPGRAGQLHGVPGIRLADASIFPDLVRGGLQLPVDAVASRIADDIVNAS